MRETTSYEGKKLPPMLGHSRGYVPLLKHALALKLWPLGLLGDGRKKHGEVFGLDLAGQKTAVFSGPAANEAYFRAPDDQFSAREVYKFMVPVFGKGVVYDCSPEIMSEQLSFLLPALKEQRLRTYVGYFNEELDRYFAGWGDEGTADIYTSTNEVTTFVAGRCLLGKDFRDNMSAEFAALYHDLQAGINLFAFYAPHLPLPAFRKRDRAREEIVRLVSRMMAERRKSGKTEEDFTQTLMEAHYKSGSALPDSEIAGLILAALFGGQHTSAVLSAWAIIEALRHPYLLGPLLAEQESVLGGRRTFAIEDIRTMPVLERLVLETERHHPPLIMLMRKVLRDFHYKDFVVPAGWLAMASPGLSHMLPDTFDRPERFDPERFAPPREEHKKANYTMITFGGGKHRCVGMAFGLLQVRSVVAYILRHFDLELVSRSPSPDYSGFVVGPTQPCLVRYRRRKQAQIAVPNDRSSAKAEGISA
ncbi:cytochrome P450 [Polyangium aurulentum]|uniref:cytochrome P450 n=1 Tax=Polyangium aurulentum TaxID=2567896 RepID=UPI0010ADBD8B|nr:cytochrome P450 [Polyangium aurulentum]UQA55169.1 cytochrome P450 [Polyangium aurulentum]